MVLLEQKLICASTVPAFTTIVWLTECKCKNLSGLELEINDRIGTLFPLLLKKWANLVLHPALLSLRKEEESTLNPIPSATNW